MELLDETTIKHTYTEALTAIQTGCLGAVCREQRADRCGMLVF